jgi:predicted dehydrogenase
MLKLDLDLVDIVTPTPTHAPLAIRALESGHNVLVEKPMSLSSRECDDMISASRRSGYSLCVNHNKRFYNSVMETKRMIEEEKLTVSRMHFAHFFVYGDERPDWILSEESGGVFWEAMVHHVYVLQHFLGRIDRVYAIARKVRNPVYDSITIVTESDGRGGLAEYERYAMAPLLAFQVFTDEGVRFDGDLFGDFVLRWPPLRAHGMPRTLQGILDDFAIPIQRRRSRLRRSVRMRSYGAVTPYKRTFYVLIRRFLSFLAGQASTPPVMPEEGLQAIEVLEAAKRSIESGEPEKVGESSSASHPSG